MQAPHTIQRSQSYSEKRRGDRIFQSGRGPSGRELARCFIVLPTSIRNFERLGRYEAALWRQVRQTISRCTPAVARAGAPLSRTPDRWQRTALGAADEDRADEP